MLFIIGKDLKRKAEGKDSDFRVRGQPVEREKIARYKKRKAVSEDALLSQLSPAAGDYAAMHPD